MLRLRVAAAVMLVAGACGGSPPVELRTAAESESSAVVLVDLPRPEDRQIPTTTTTAPPTTTTAPPPPPTTTTTAQAAPVVQACVRTCGGGGYADPALDATWDRLAGCETGGTMDWATNTGNGYYGGLQFSLSSWQAVGGVGRPDQASREAQIAAGRRLWAQGGWGHWPACSSKLGYR